MAKIKLLISVKVADTTPKVVGQPSRRVEYNGGGSASPEPEKAMEITDSGKKKACKVSKNLNELPMNATE
jgi:hypothetical protein